MHHAATPHSSAVASRNVDGQHEYDIVSEFPGLKSRAYRWRCAKIARLLHELPASAVANRIESDSYTPVLCSGTDAP
jgi:hypothetical protein